MTAKHSLAGRPALRSTEVERLSVAIDDVPEFIGVEIRLSLF
jgi:hypothetical protein